MWQRNPISEPYRVTAPNLLNMHFHQHNKTSIQCDAVKDTYAFILIHTQAENVTKNMFFSQFHVMLLPHSICFPETLSLVARIYMKIPHILPIQIDAIWAPRHTTYSPIDIEEGEKGK